VTADPHALLRDGLRSMPQARELDDRRWPRGLRHRV